MQSSIQQRAMIYCVAGAGCGDVEATLYEQLRQCRHYAAACDYQVVDIFSDREPTNYVLDRTSMKCMISSLVTSRAAHVIITPSLDALAKEVEEQERLKQLFDMLGVVIHTTEHTTLQLAA